MLRMLNRAAMLCWSLFAGLSWGNVTQAAWPATDPSNTGGWIVNSTYTDEFNGSSLDTSKWNNGHLWWAGGRAPGLFTNKSVSVSGGSLRINNLSHNKVKNYGFDEAVSGSSTQLKDWTPQNNPNFIRVADTNPGDGPSALVHRAHWGLQMTGTGEVTQTVTGLTGNTQYRLTAFAHRGTSSGGTIGVRTTGGTNIVSQNVTATGNYPDGGTLTPTISQLFTTSAGQTSVVVYIKNNGSGTFYADSIAIVPRYVYNGTLELANGQDATTGCVMSKTRVPPGYYECRMKAGTGCHASSFWFQSGGNYPGCCGMPPGWSEIDVTEAQGGSTTDPSLVNKLITDYHYYPPPTLWNPQAAYGVQNITIDNVTTAFRTYGIMWDATHLYWYYGSNATPVRTTPIPVVAGYENYPFEIDQHMFFDTETFWYRGVPAYGMNSTMEVDYVRGWNKSLVPNAVYEIFPLHAGSLRLNSTGTTNGSNVNVTTDTNANSQRWKAIDVGGGNFELAPLNAPNQRLDIPGGWDVDGLNVQTYQTNGHIAQKWKIEAAIPAFGVVEAIPQCAPTKRMEVENAGTSSGSNVRMKLDTSANHQRWVFTRYGQVGF